VKSKTNKRKANGETTNRLTDLILDQEYELTLLNSNIISMKAVIKLLIDNGAR
jgi:hypothetical protein